MLQIEVIKPEMKSSTNYFHPSVAPLPGGEWLMCMQAFVGDDWQTLSSVEGQNTDTITHEFAPVTTDRIRIAVAAANGKNSMVTEVEVYAK